MRALIIGKTLLDELGIGFYYDVIKDVLKYLNVEPILADQSIERKALLLYLIGARIMASEGLSKIAREALDTDIVLYLGPCIRKAFKELKFMTPIQELTIHEFVLPKVQINASGKALLGCKWREVRPGIENVLRSYGLEIVEDCPLAYIKAIDYNDYIRFRDYIADKYSGYILTCPYQLPPFRETGKKNVEILMLAKDILENSGGENQRDYDN